MNDEAEAREMAAVSGETVSELYERAAWADVLFPANGRWWADRGSSGVQPGDVLTVWLVGGRVEGVHQAVRLTGSPDTLRRVAGAIIAQVESAEINS